MVFSRKQSTWNNNQDLKVLSNLTMFANYNILSMVSNKHLGLGLAVYLNFFSILVLLVAKLILPFLFTKLTQ